MQLMLWHCSLSRSRATGKVLSLLQHTRTTLTNCLLDCSGFHMRCPDGEHRHFVPVIAAYVADIKEANEVFNVAPYPSACPDINTLVSKDKMNDPEHEAELRTEAGMLEVHIHTSWTPPLPFAACSGGTVTIMQVLEEANELLEQDPAEGRELLKRFSLSIKQLVRSARHCHH